MMTSAEPEPWCAWTEEPIKLELLVVWNARPLPQLRLFVPGFRLLRDAAHAVSLELQLPWGDASFKSAPVRVDVGEAYNGVRSCGSGWVTLDATRQRLQLIMKRQELRALLAVRDGAALKCVKDGLVLPRLSQHERERLKELWAQLPRELSVSAPLPVTSAPHGAVRPSSSAWFQAPTPVNTSAEPLPRTPSARKRSRHANALDEIEALLDEIEAAAAERERLIESNASALKRRCARSLETRQQQTATLRACELTLDRSSVTDTTLVACYRAMEDLLATRKSSD